jgi:hypothetical protein
LHRKETREFSLREDFPEIDNVSWMKYTISTKRGEGMTMEEVPLGGEEYPYPPPREKFNQLHLFRGVASDSDTLRKAVSLR